MASLSMTGVVSTTSTCSSIISRVQTCRVRTVRRCLVFRTNTSLGSGARTTTLRRGAVISGHVVWRLCSSSSAPCASVSWSGCRPSWLGDVSDSGRRTPLVSSVRAVAAVGRIRPPRKCGVTYRTCDVGLTGLAICAVANARPVRPPRKCGGTYWLRDVDPPDRASGTGAAWWAS